MYFNDSPSSVTEVLVLLILKCLFLLYSLVILLVLFVLLTTVLNHFPISEVFLNLSYQTKQDQTINNQLFGQGRARCVNTMS